MELAHSGRAWYAAIAAALILLAAVAIAASLMRSQPSVATTTTVQSSTSAPSSTVAYSRPSLAGLLNVSDSGADFELTYATITTYAYSNTTQKQQMNFTIMRYLNASRLQVSILSPGQNSSVSYIEIFVGTGIAYEACNTNLSFSECYRAPISPSIDSIVANEGALQTQSMASLNFSSVSYSQASFGDNPCTLARGIYALAGQNGSVSACFSNATGIIYNFTLFQGTRAASTLVSGHLVSTFVPSSAPAVTALPNVTMQVMPSDLAIGLGSSFYALSHPNAIIVILSLLRHRFF